VLTGSLPPATIYGTWIETLEVVSLDDGQPYDLSVFTEIKLVLRDPQPDSRFIEIVLKKSSGQITVPSPGIVMWRAEMDTMGSLAAKLYEVIMTFEGPDGIFVLVLGPISILA